MLRPAGQPVHDTLLPGEHRVSPCSFTSTSVSSTNATVFDAEIVRAAAANPRLFARVAGREKKVSVEGGGKEGAYGRGWGGDVERAKGGREVLAGERGMRGSVSACT